MALDLAKQQKCQFKVLEASTKLDIDEIVF